jgi:hypothetical protein
VLSSGASSGKARGMSDGSIRRVAEGERDEELDEEWEWRSSDWLLSASVCQRARQRFPWQVSVGAIGEYVRDEGLLADTDTAMVRALSEVEGVTAVAGEDFGVWVVAGTPEGSGLAAAARDALRPFTSRIHGEYELAASEASTPSGSRPSGPPGEDPILSYPGTVVMDGPLGEELKRRLRGQSRGDE